MAQRSCRWMHRLLACAVTAAAVGMAIGGAAAQDSVGITAAVNPQAQGTPPDRAARTLNVGLDMFRNERVVTGPEGKTQLLFIDGSALSIGPNSEVVLDEFVYEPTTGTGKLALTATKGVFRVVGGKLSKTEPATLRTPTATIGIRGGVGTVVLPDPAAPARTGFVSLDFGKALTVEGVQQGGEAVAHTVTRPGTGVVFGPGGTVLPPGPIQPELLVGALNAVEGSRGSSGGASEQPTDARVQQTAFDQQGSALPPETARAADVVATDIAGVATETAESADLAQASQAATLASLASASGGASTISAPPSFIYTGRYKTTPGGASRGSGDASTAFNQTLIGLLDAGFFKADLDPGNSSSSSSGIGLFDFTAPSSGSMLSGTPLGTFFSYGSTGTSSPFGPIDGTGFLSTAGDFVYFEGREIDFTDDRSVTFAGIATPPAVLNALAPGAILTYQLRQDGILPGSNLAFVLPPSGGNLPGIRSNAYIIRNGVAGAFGTFLQANLAIFGQGTAQASAVSTGVGILVGSLQGDNLNLIGNVRGSTRSGAFAAANFLSGSLGFATDAAGHGVYGSANLDFFVLESSTVQASDGGSGDLRAVSLPAPGGMMEHLGTAFSNSLYFPNNLAQRIATPAGVGTLRDTRSLNGFAVAYVERYDSAGTFLGNGGSPIFAVRQDFQLSFNALHGTVSGSINDLTSPTTYVLPFGGSTADGRSAFIDNKAYAAVEATGSGAQRAGQPVSVKMYVVGNDLVTSSGFLPSGVGYCDCSASTFGYWGADIVHAGGIDRMHLGQFVGGSIPVSVPISGTATYTGHFVADINKTAGANVGARFKAIGNMQMNYNFSTAGGPISITNFDGGTLSGSVSATPGSPNFQGSVAGSTSNLVGGSGTVIGSFFQSGSDPVAEAGGFITGAAAQASFTGIFQGKR